MEDDNITIIKGKRQTLRSTFPRYSMTNNNLSARRGPSPVHRLILIYCQNRTSRSAHRGWKVSDLGLRQRRVVIRQGVGLSALSADAASRPLRSNRHALSFASDSEMLLQQRNVTLHSIFDIRCYDRRDEFTWCSLVHRIKVLANNVRRGYNYCVKTTCLTLI